MPGQKNAPNLTKDIKYQEEELAKLKAECAKLYGRIFSTRKLKEVEKNLDIKTAELEVKEHDLYIFKQNLAENRENAEKQEAAEFAIATSKKKEAEAKINARTAEIGVEHTKLETLFEKERNKFKEFMKFYRSQQDHLAEQKEVGIRVSEGLSLYEKKLAKRDRDLDDDRHELSKASSDFNKRLKKDNKDLNDRERHIKIKESGLEGLVDEIQERHSNETAALTEKNNKLNARAKEIKVQEDDLKIENSILSSRNAKLDKDLEELARDQVNLEHNWKVHKDAKLKFEWEQKRQRRY